MRTDPQPTKTIIVSHDDVLTALERARQQKQRPASLSTVSDVARWVLAHVYDIEVSSRGAMWYVHQAELRRLLAAMVDEGALIKRTGEDWWEHGAPTWLGRWNGHYYVLPDQAEVWEKEAERKREAALQEGAEEYARGVLAKRYPEEFADLVQDYRKTNGAAFSQGGDDGR